MPQAALGMSVMKSRGSNLHGNMRQAPGFSLVELVVALAVGLILMAVATPAALRAYHTYQLSYSAAQLADIVRLTRYEAIRRNKPLNCVIQPSAGNPGMTQASMTDTLGNALPGVGAMTILLGPSGNLVDPGTVPGANAFPASAQLGPTAPAAVPANGTTLTFDARGALASGNVTVFYLTNTTVADAGYRVVLLTPAGSVQIWTGDGTGVWQQLR